MSLNRRGEPLSSVGPEEHDYIGQVIAEDAAERAPRNRRVTAEPAPVPPAGDVEVLGWALNDGDEHPIDITLQWGVAKHWPEYATPLVDRAHVTRLTAERDEIRAIKDSAIESVALLHAERVGLLAEVEQLKRWQATVRENSPLLIQLDALQSELTKAREALAGMVEYFPEGHSDGECFSVETAKAVLAHQSAPAAKLIERGTTHGFEQSANTCRHDDKSGVWWREGNVTRTGRECNACGHVVEDAPAAKGGE